MSLILDALRKSEAERRRGQAPDLFAGTPVAVPTRTSPWRHAPVLAGGALLLIAVALLFRPGAAPRGAADATGTSAIAPATTHDAADGAGDDAGAVAPSRPAFAPGPPPATATPTPTHATAPAAPAARAATPAPASAAAASPAPSTAAPPPLPRPAPFPPTLVPPAAAPPVVPAPAPAPADVPGPANEYVPTLAALTPGERAALPPLKLSMHVWNSDAARRFAIVDGQRVVEGTRVGAAVVTAIRRDGVVLDVNGRSLLLPRP